MSLQRFEPPPICPPAPPAQADNLLWRLLPRLRRRLAPPNWSAPAWREEVAQIAALAVAGALCDFDATRSGDLDAFVLRRVSAEVRAAHRREWAFGQRLAVLSSQADYDLEANAATGPSAEPAASTAQPDPDLREALDRLLGQEQRVIGLLFFQSLTEPEAGQVLACNHSTVNRWKRAALNHLRELLLRENPLPLPRRPFLERHSRFRKV